MLNGEYEVNMNISIFFLYISIKYIGMHIKYILYLVSSKTAAGWGDGQLVALF